MKRQKTESGVGVRGGKRGGRAGGCEGSECGLSSLRAASQVCAFAETLALHLQYVFKLFVSRVSIKPEKER